MKIFGLDISLDHGGVVCLDENGRVFDYVYLTSIKKFFDVDPGHSVFLSKKGKDESKDTFRLRRLREFASIPMFLMEDISSAYFSIEGYAYASQSTSICQIAELTGYLKHLLFEGGGNIRIHDPLTVKLFATNKGNASKKEVVISSGLSTYVPEGLIKRKVIKKKGKTTLPQELWWEDYDGPITDIADAYFLARMVYRELQLRSGDLLPNQLSEGERRIFLRVSKAYPVNILDRTFICKQEKGE